MLNKSKALSSFSVDNIQKAKEFYGQTLGLNVSESHGMLSLHLAGGRVLMIASSCSLSPHATVRGAGGLALPAAVLV